MFCYVADHEVYTSILTNRTISSTHYYRIDLPLIQGDSARCIFTSRERGYASKDNHAMHMRLCLAGAELSLICTCFHACSSYCFFTQAITVRGIEIYQVIPRMMTDTRKIKSLKSRGAIKCNKNDDNGFQKILPSRLC